MRSARPCAAKTPSIYGRTVDPEPWYSCAGFDEHGTPLDVEWHATHDAALRRANRIAYKLRDGFPLAGAR